MQGSRLDDQKSLFVELGEVRERLVGLPPVDPGLARLMAGLELRPAAVLLPLYWHEDRWWMLFTRRSSKVSAHKGQISFPGGRVDHDDDSIRAAALRETWEEIGVPREEVEIVGRLPDTLSIAGYRISPVVGKIPYPYAFRISEYEIDEVFGAPLASLRKPGVLKVLRKVRVGSNSHEVYSFMWKEGYAIWGATARMLKMFLELFGGPLPAERHTDFKEIEMQLTF